jgi:hypothetical protein
MVLDSAKIKHVQLNIELNWNNGMKFTKKLMDYIVNWFGISQTLLQWDNLQKLEWPRNPDLESIGIMGPHDAMGIVQLVLNVPP